MHSIHTSHDELLDAIFHILGPLTIIIPNGAVGIACHSTDIFQPFTALLKSANRGYMVDIYDNVHHSPPH